MIYKGMDCLKTLLGNIFAKNFVYMLQNNIFVSSKSVEIIN